jgi:hypothetical protein
MALDPRNTKTHNQVRAWLPPQAQQDEQTYKQVEGNHDSKANSRCNS